MSPPRLTRASTTVTRRLDRQLRKASIREGSTAKLLLLGPSGSGKSTLFKQWRLLYGSAYTTVRERLAFKPAIYENIIGGIKCLIRGQEELSGRGDLDRVYKALRAVENSTKLIPPVMQLIVSYLHQLDFDFQMTKEAKAAASKILELPDDSAVSRESATQIKEVWADEGIQMTWENRTECSVGISKSLSYFVRNLDRIAKKPSAYRPTKQDVIYVHLPTTGVIESQFDIRNHRFKIVDVGGQRTERKKWMNLFTDVTGVVFLASLTGFDEVLEEDPETLRMVEALRLFKEVLEKFDSMAACPSIILMLNDSDLFRQKISQGHSIRNCFPDYPGPDEDRPSFRYIKAKFLSQRSPSATQSLRIFVHRTTAVDTEAMRYIFSDVNHIVTSRALQKAGLLVI